MWYSFYKLGVMCENKKIMHKAAFRELGKSQSLTLTEQPGQGCILDGRAARPKGLHLVEFWS